MPKIAVIRTKPATPVQVFRGIFCNCSKKSLEIQSGSNNCKANLPETSSTCLFLLLKVPLSSLAKEESSDSESALPYPFSESDFLSDWDWVKKSSFFAL